MGTVTLAFYAQFTASKAGLNGLSPVWDVERVTRADGTRTALQTGAATNITVGRRGLYGYYQTGCDLDLYDYVATAITADTSVDLKEVPALWTYWIADIGDASVASVTGAVGSVTGNVGGNVAGSVASVSGAVGSVTGAVTVATNNDKTGYALTSAYDAAKTSASSADYTAARAAKLDNLDAAVTSRLAGASYSAPPSAASVADAVWDEATADHAATGTTGKALANAGSAADPLTNTVPGTYASGTAGAALGRIGGGQITTTSPVAVSGDVTIVRGDDYNAADGRALDWTDVSAAWPDLTGATIAVTVQTTATTTWTKAGSVVTPTGSGKKVRVEPTAADTATFAGGASYPFDVQATLSSGRKVTLLRGTWYVLADYSV